MRLAFSFGGTAAIVGSVSLIIGLDAVHASKASIIAGLMVAALADILTDSLSVHIYQESERLEARPAFMATLTNFATRALISLSFVFFVLLLPIGMSITVSVVWGLVLLSGLSAILARVRKVGVVSEISKHLAVAIAAVVVSKIIGTCILSQIG